MSGIDAFLEKIRPRLVAELPRVDAASGASLQWVAIEDERGFVLTSLDPVIEIHAMLGGLMSSGADAAAYLSYVLEPVESILAYVWTRDPEDSDVCRCPLRRNAGRPELGDWVRTVV